MKAIQIERFGNPAEAVNVPDVGPPAPGEVVIALDRLAPLIAAGTISVPIVATYGFEQFKEAIANAVHSCGKVLFTPKV
jgi:NADPH:quinone reductase-like Zn-dependent oxidoreductase